MKEVKLGKTKICVVQNGFGALPIQRISKEDAIRLVRKAYQGGMRVFDTAAHILIAKKKLAKHSNHSTDPLTIWQQRRWPQTRISFGNSWKPL